MCIRPRMVRAVNLVKDVHHIIHAPLPRDTAQCFRFLLVPVVDQHLLGPRLNVRLYSIFHGHSSTKPCGHQLCYISYWSAQHVVINSAANPCFKESGWVGIVARLRYLFGFINYWHFIRLPASSLTLLCPRRLPSSTMSKIVTFAELKAHSTKESLYILLHEKGVSSPDVVCLTLTLPSV